MVLLSELYPFIPLSVTLIIFQGHNSVEQSQVKISCSYPIKLKLCTIVYYVKKILNVFKTFIYLWTCSGEIVDIFPRLKITFSFGFFSDTINASSFKLCMVITLDGVYIVILDFMTLTLFQGHRCVRNIKC